ncbi:hypothetical protein FA95DRAFT_1594523 [Auriscalpium vulgare]|uniref:Uncharacterized protein n=1 Tax=Auriscalpium vulgare TaxID=40419 RepID=A0ACB8S0B1_9AGAM|nr:hypothetical protein FA95DRAFT_1594523 [Auriscalpium vulgare]
MYIEMGIKGKIRELNEDLRIAHGDLERKGDAGTLLKAMVQQSTGAQITLQAQKSWLQAQIGVLQSPCEFFEDTVTKLRLDLEATSRDGGGRTRDIIHQLPTAPLQLRARRATRQQCRVGEWRRKMVPKSKPVFVSSLRAPAARTRAHLAAQSSPLSQAMSLPHGKVHREGSEDKSNELVISIAAPSSSLAVLQAFALPSERRHHRPSIGIASPVLTSASLRPRRIPSTHVTIPSTASTQDVQSAAAASCALSQSTRAESETARPNMSRPSISPLKAPSARPQTRRNAAGRNTVRSATSCTQSNTALRAPLKRVQMNSRVMHRRSRNNRKCDPHTE